MKTKKWVLVLFAAFALAACGTESDDFCENPGAKCPDNSAIEASSCCTETSCYWVYNGQHYDCTGTNCTAVINQIVTAACASGSAYVNTADLELLKAQMNAVTNRLLLEARSASGCAAVPVN